MKIFTFLQFVLFTFSLSSNSWAASLSTQQIQMMEALVGAGQFDPENGVIETKDPITEEPIRITPFVFNTKKNKELKVKGVGRGPIKTEIDYLIRVAFQPHNSFDWSEHRDQTTGTAIFSFAVLLKNGPDNPIYRKIGYNRTGWLIETSAGGRGIDVGAGYLVEFYQTVDGQPSKAVDHVNKALGFKAWIKGMVFHGWSESEPNQTYAGLGAGVGFHLIFVPAFFAIDQLINVEGDESGTGLWRTRMRLGLEFGF